MSWSSPFTGRRRGPGSREPVGDRSTADVLRSQDGNAHVWRRSHETAPDVDDIESGSEHFSTKGDPWPAGTAQSATTAPAAAPPGAPARQIGRASCRERG